MGTRTTLSTTCGVIAAGHAETAAAGVKILRLGGNAFDAAVAGMLASFVAEATLTSAGGSGFLLAHTATGEDILFDFFSQTPLRRRAAREVNFYPVSVNFGDAAQEFHIGPGSMAVPGNVAGLFHVHRRLGRLPMAVVAAPAVALAKNGLLVSDFQSFCQSVLEPILLATPEARQIFAPVGRLLAPGERLSMPEFADTLEWLVAEGPAVFYEGEIARRLVADSERLGGHLTARDLREYRVIERVPLGCGYRGYRVLTNPEPSAGGTLIAFALRLLEQADCIRQSYASPEHLGLLANVMRLTDEARRHDFASGSEALLSAGTLARYVRRLTKPWGSTTHLSVLDEEGNAASVTSTNGEGSAYVIPGTGIMVNNMLGEDDLHPEGFESWAENRRIASMMAPSLVLEDGRPWVVLGSGGSKRIRTALLQVISNLVDFQMPLSEAVASPRLHWENHVLHLEPGLLAPTHSLHDAVIRWREQNFFFGGVHAVACDALGNLTGSGDGRRNGAARFS
ncbi:gamma-glutamyltransferase family protein [Gloeobacter violaceus]|uniref:Gamma-glutamyltranspeptidase n=1 Tax=Gloeobacter violaceus (strain ATCC 29082 / PCC 7421) TaxID=251221 RepID=Q7NI25_GLOVI|nr:gamma-glutamyltransferase [Gloeobacter violaceus]BAC90300.1 gamma-glutamyltranspeptidase [Gloeobacter violaceus PCC 7421]